MALRRKRRRYPEQIAKSVADSGNATNFGKDQLGSPNG